MSTNGEDVNTYEDEDDDCYCKLLICICCCYCQSDHQPADIPSQTDPTKKNSTHPPVHTKQPRRSLQREIIITDVKINCKERPSVPVPLPPEIDTPVIEEVEDFEDYYNYINSDKSSYNFTVFGWGKIFNGPGFGDAKSRISSSPTAINFPSKLKSVVCGNSHTLFVLEDGTLWSWGSNQDGQLGHRVSKCPQKVEGLETVEIMSASAGFAHNLIVTSKGLLLSWGSNSHGQLGYAGKTKQINRPTFISFDNFPTKMIVQVAAGDFHSLIMTRDGEILSCGSNSHGQLGLGIKDEMKQIFTLIKPLLGHPIAQIQTGGTHSFALTVQGGVLGWGRNNCGQLGIGSLIDKYRPTSLDMFSSVVVRHISTGSDHSAFLTKEGGVFTMGSNEYGQLGHDTLLNEVYPRKVLEFGSVITQVACGRAHTLCLTEGKLYSFGVGSNGQLGYERENAVSPFHIKSLHTIHSIYAGGDQSFTIDQTNGSDKPDYRIKTPESKIWTISEEFVNEICIATVSPGTDMSFLDDFPLEVFPEPELQKKLGKGIMTVMESIFFFQSPTFLNASFHLSNDDGPIWKLAYDLNKAEAVLSKLNRTKNKDFKKLFESILVNYLLPKLNTLWTHGHKDALPAFVMFTLLPVFYSGKYPAVAIEYFRVVVSGPKPIASIVNEWLFNSPMEQLLRLISVCKKTIIFILSSDTMTTSEQDTLCSDCSKFLEIMYELNKDKTRVSYHTFTIPLLASKLNIKDDYINWITPERQRFSFCDYPFVFDGAAKTELLKIDQSLQMHIAMDRTARNPAHIILSVLFRTDPREALFLNLEVNRNNLVNDFVRQIVDVSTLELKKPLKVKFIGEEAVDVGGVRKEFFLLLTKEILDPKFGMFSTYEESRLMWFNGSSYDDEDDLYYIIGLLCGLAIYNLTIINLPFPLALYKKLLNEKVDLSDLKELNPTVGRSLEQLLDYKEPDLESVFSLFFEISEDAIGESKTVELKTGGSSIAVTQENKMEFVELYVNHVFHRSVQINFDPFKEAFEEVCGSKILRLFHPQQLQEMVIGNEDYDWGELQENCTYDGYEPSDPVVKRFWEVFYSLELDQKKNFLLFLTGNDKIPIMGMKSIKIRIQRVNDQNYLPVAHTCFNLLDLPPYQTTEKMKYKLVQAIQQTQGFSLQ